MTQKLDVIPPETAKTLDGLFQERVRRSPNALAYRNFDEATGTWKDYSWSDVEKLVARWQGAFEADGFQPGDRVAIVLRNSVPWVVFDQAAMGLDLVTVPLYTSDRPDNIAYIVQNSGAKLLLFENPEQWGQFAEVKDQLAGLKPRRLRESPVRAIAGSAAQKPERLASQGCRCDQARQLRRQEACEHHLYVRHDRASERRDAVAPQHADQRVCDAAVSGNLP